MGRHIWDISVGKALTSRLPPVTHSPKPHPLRTNLKSTAGRLRHPHPHTLGSPLPQNDFLSLLPPHILPYPLGPHLLLGRNMLCGPKHERNRHLHFRHRKPTRERDLGNRRDKTGCTDGNSGLSGGYCHLHHPVRSDYSTANQQREEGWCVANLYDRWEVRLSL